MPYFILQTLFWLLLAFILGLIFGRWIKRLICLKRKPKHQTSTTYEPSNSSTHDSASYMETADRMALRDQVSLNEQSNKQSAGIAGTAAAVATTASVAISKTTDTATQKENPVSVDSPVSNLNQLQTIEGINPAIETLLHNNGINTLQDLSTTSEKEIKTMLEKNDQYNIASWIKQAKLAVDGKVENLIESQKDKNV